MSEEPAASAPATPGARLGKAREGRGWTVAQAADLMRLPVGVVESLEADRYSELGAPVFARGHLRRYATLLDLPVEPLMEAYDRSQAGPAPPSLIPQASAHTPVRAAGRRPRLPAEAWYAVGLAVLIAAGVGGWWWTQRKATDVAPVAAPAAEEPAAEQPDDPRPAWDAGTAFEPAGPEPIPEAAPPPAGEAP